MKSERGQEREALAELVRLYELKQADPDAYAMQAEAKRLAWYRAKAVLAACEEPGSLTEVLGLLREAALACGHEAQLTNDWYENTLACLRRHGVRDTEQELPSVHDDRVERYPGSYADEGLVAEQEHKR